MKISIGERYRSPEDCACEKCNTLDSLVIKLSTKEDNIKLKCCGCGHKVWLSEEEMFIPDEEPFRLITNKQLFKERLKAPFKSK